MTHLQQTCAAMNRTQEQQQRLYEFERARLAGRFVTLPRMVDEVREAKVIYGHVIRQCNTTLARNFPAANDATTLPGAA